MESDLTVLRKSLASVLRDMDTFALGMKKAKADSDEALNLMERLKRKSTPLAEQKQYLEEEIAKLESMQRVKGQVEKQDMQNRALLHEEALAINAGVDWERKNGYAQFATAPMPVQKGVGRAR